MYLVNIYSRSKSPLPPLPSSTVSVSVAMPSVGLVRKLIGVLDALEKLPVYTHEPPGPILNLQSVQKRIRFALERSPGATDLRDCAGKTLRAEPLASVDGLEKFLNGIVSQCVVE